MALTNRDRIGKALDQLQEALLPFISSQLYDQIGSDWQDRLPPTGNNLQDVSVLLKLFMQHWATVFKRLLSDSDRAYVSELLEARNKWAHAQTMVSTTLTATSTPPSASAAISTPKSRLNQFGPCGKSYSNRSTPTVLATARATKPPSLTR
jgi:hypothetical protein